MNNPSLFRRTTFFLAGVMQGVALFGAMVLLGTVLFMGLAHVVGYVPYGDRPGPGWIGWFPVRSFGGALSIFRYFLSWSLLAVPLAAIYAIPLLVVFGFISLTKVPRWVIAALGGPIFGLSAFLIVAGIGWYIAIALPPVIAASALGAVFGAWLLPYRIPFKPRPSVRNASPEADPSAPCADRSIPS